MLFSRLLVARKINARADTYQAFWTVRILVSDRVARFVICCIHTEELDMDTGVTAARMQHVCAKYTQGRACEHKLRRFIILPRRHNRHMCAGNGRLSS